MSADIGRRTSAATVATTLGAARAPDGCEIVEQCPLPDVASRMELNYLDGKVACELSKHLYGVDKCWFLRKKKA